MQAEEEVGKEIQKDQNSRNIEAQYTTEVNLNLTVVPVDFGWCVLTDKEKKGCDDTANTGEFLPK